MIMNSTFYADILFFTSRSPLLSSFTKCCTLLLLSLYCVYRNNGNLRSSQEKNYLYSFSLHLHSSVVVINKISLLTRSRTKLAHLCHIQTVQTALRVRTYIKLRWDFLTCDYYIHTLIHTNTHYTQHDDDHQIKVISFQLLY